MPTANLCQRVLSIIAKNCGEKVPAKGALIAADTALLDKAKALLAIVRAELDEQAFHRALAAIWEVIADANRYVDAQAAVGARQDRSGTAPTPCCGCWPRPSGA